jgi:Protein of unknown function DUF2617
MGVRSGGSRVGDLTFRVFDRTLHPDWFATREFRRIEQLGWEADLRIIDGGHAVVFRAGTIRLAEILSGPETTLPEAGLVFHSQVRREKSATVRPGGGVEYQNCLEVERVDLEIFRHLCEEIRLDGSRNRLYHSFPSSNRLAPAPISHVVVTPRINDLSIQWFHTFPDECAIVRTQSLFEVKSPGSNR